MIQNVFAGILIFVAVVGGIWCLWVEHGGGTQKEELTGEEAEE